MKQAKKVKKPTCCVISEQPYRSEGRGVNQDYDMVRVTMDLPRREWIELRRTWGDKVGLMFQIEGEQA